MEENLFLNAVRQGRNNFWRYFLTIALIFTLSLISTGILVGIVFTLERTTNLNDLSVNSYLIVVMLPFLFIILGLWFGLRVLHGRSLRSIIAPVGKLRWSNIFLSAIAWLVLSGLADLFTYLADPGRYTWSFNPAQFIPYAVLALVLVPIQTTAEELLFRGYLTQGVSLIHSRWWGLPLIVPAVLFGLLHSANPEVGTYGFGWMMANYIGVGLLLGYLALRSQGLELSLGLHAANNLYSALMVTYTSSAIRSPALFTLRELDPRLSLVSLVVAAALYLLLITAWKRGAVWRLLALAVLLLSACSPLGQAPQRAKEDVLPLQDCRLSAEGFPIQYSAKCGQLEVYENRTAQTGRKISLYVAVIPASSQNKADDPLFLLAGGPGQAATEAFVPLLAALERVRFKHDLVLVDQRGTGKSHQLRCPASDQADQPGPSQEWSIDQQVAELDSCLKTLDADPSLYTTDIAMQDLDQVRQALGYDKINLLGVSYGTRAALMYQRLFPEQTRSLVLDSVVPMGWPLGDAAARDAQRAFDLMIQRCQADAPCQVAFPQANQELTIVLDHLKKTPAVVDLNDPTTGEPVQINLTRDAAMITVRLMLYSSEYTALLPLIIHQAAQGDLKPLAAQYQVVVRSFTDAISDGMYLSVICSEDAPFYTELGSGQESFFEYNRKDVQTQCQHWPHQEPDAVVRQAVTSNVPVLLLSGGADPVTPPENAAQAAKNLPNSIQVVLPGLGHNVMYQGCLPKVIADFIEQGKTDELDLSCAKIVKPQPFFVGFTGPKP